MRMACAGCCGPTLACAGCEAGRLLPYLDAAQLGLALLPPCCLRLQLQLQLALLLPQGKT